MSRPSLRYPPALLTTAEPWFRDIHGVPGSQKQRRETFNS